MTLHNENPMYKKTVDVIYPLSSPIRNGNIPGGMQMPNCIMGCFISTVLFELSVLMRVAQP